MTIEADGAAEVTEEPGNVQDLIDNAVKEAGDAGETEQNTEGQEVSKDSTEGDSGESAGEAGAETDGEGKEEVTKGKGKHFVALRGGEEVELPDLEDLKLSFRSRGEDQEKTLEQLVRRVQQADAIESSLEEIKNQRNQTSQELDQALTKVEGLSRDREIFLNALSDESGETFKKIQDAYFKHGGNKGNRQPANIPSQGPQDRQLALRALQHIIVPHAKALASAFDANETEVGNQIIQELQSEPARFMTEDTIADIMNVRLPKALKEAGYTAESVPEFDPGILKGESTSKGRITPRKAPEDMKESELVKENKKLKEQLSNLSTKGKLGKSPPAAGDGAVSTGGDKDSSPLDLSKAESASDVMKVLRDAQEL